MEKWNIQNGVLYAFNSWQIMLIRTISAIVPHDARLWCGKLGEIKYVKMFDEQNFTIRWIFTQHITTSYQRFCKHKTLIGWALMNCQSPFIKFIKALHCQFFYASYTIAIVTYSYLSSNLSKLMPFISRVIGCMIVNFFSLLIIFIWRCIRRNIRSNFTNFS